ncbi:MAG: MBL fold metallo-hydrolase [Candidatus Hodarchaeales archaeon]
MSKKKSSTDPIIELMSIELAEREVAFIYFGWAGILLKTRNKILAFDVSNYILKKHDIRNINSLDLQFNSHTHYDHFELPSTQQMYQQTQAKIIAEPQVYTELEGKIPEDDLFVGKPEKPLQINEFKIKSIVGIHPRPITLFHVEWNNFKVFHGGDSDYIPLSEFPTDLAFIPTGSPSPSCSPEKGLKMTVDLNPTIAVAMHGTKTQTQKFEKLVKKELPETKVLLPEKNKFSQFTLKL